MQEESGQSQEASGEVTAKGSLQVYEFQVSGKTPKYINNTNGTIYKQFSEAEYQFYEFFNAIPSNDPRTSLRPFIPEYFGVCEQEAVAEGTQGVQREGGSNQRSIWIDHIASRGKSESVPCQRFLLLRNLTFGYGMPNIMDLKLGVKKDKKSNAKFEKSTTNSHKFRINGLMVGLREGESFTECFMSKYHGQKVTVEDTETYLSLFFFDGQHILGDLLHQVILRLEELIASFRKFTGVHFISSSLFLAYDALAPGRFTLNLIDFDKYEHTAGGEADAVIEEGLVNVSRFLQGVWANRDVHLQRLRRRDLDVFKEQEVVPQEKIDQYTQ